MLKIKDCEKEVCCVCDAEIEEPDIDDCDECGNYFHILLCGRRFALNHICNNCLPRTGITTASWLDEMREEE